MARGQIVGCAHCTGVAPRAPGFPLSLSTDDTCCAFSLKDRPDPCGVRIFSDHDSLIDEARPNRGG